jgi:hypothetical protein
MSEVFADLLDHLKLDQFTPVFDDTITAAAEECRCELCNLAI